MSKDAIKPLAYYESLGEIELGRGNVISSIDLTVFLGDYPVYSSSAVGAGEFGRYGRFMFDEELITWSIDGGGRPFYRPKHRYSVTNVCGYLRIKSSGAWNYRYLHALLEKLQSGIQFDYQMKAHPSVIRELYRFGRISLGEQQAIGEILDTLDTAIVQTESIIAKLKSVKQGLLHDLLTRGIDANGELRPPQVEAPQLYKESPLGWIPREWEVDSIVKLTTSSAIGPFGSDLVATDYRTTGVPVIFVRDVKPGNLIWKSEVYVSARKAQALVAHGVVAGDVVATKMGLPPCVSAVYPDSMPNGIVTADIVRLRPSLTRILPLWMSAFINAPPVLKQVEQITAGVTRPKVTLRDVRDLRLAVPSLEEQHVLLNRVEAMNSRIRLEGAALDKYLVEKSGLMDDLLTGRVRVTPLLEAEL